MTYSTTWYNSTVSTNSCFTIYFTVSRVCRQQMQLGGVFWDSAVEYALVIINFLFVLQCEYQDAYAVRVLE